MVFELIQSISTAAQTNSETPVGIWCHLPKVKREGKMWLLPSAERAICRSKLVLGWAGLGVWPCLLRAFSVLEKGVRFGLKNLPGSNNRAERPLPESKTIVNSYERCFPPNAKEQLTWHLSKWFLANKLLTNTVFFMMSKIIYRMPQFINGFMIAGTE